jgi:hypothetical protein
MRSNLGKAWVIIEEHFHTQESFLISIINARKGRQYIQEYIEQIYVDSLPQLMKNLCTKK